MDTVELRDSWGMTIATLPLSNAVRWECPSYIAQMKIASVEINAGERSGTYKHEGLPVTLYTGDSIVFHDIPAVMAIFGDMKPTSMNKVGG